MNFFFERPNLQEIWFIRRCCYGMLWQPDTVALHAWRGQNNAFFTQRILQLVTLAWTTLIQDLVESSATHIKQPKLNSVPWWRWTHQCLMVLFLQNPLKSISLIGAEIEALEQDGGFDWTIKPQGSKRTFFLRAGSAEEQQQWMVAICEEQMSSGEHASNACVVQ